MKEQHFNIDLTVAINENENLTEQEAKQKIVDSIDAYDDMKTLIAQRTTEVDEK